MFYKRPSFRMGGTPTGIDSLTPRVQAREGFFGNRNMFLLPSNLKNLQNQRFDVGTSGGQINLDQRMKSFPQDASEMGVASVAKTKPVEQAKFMIDDFSLSEMPYDVIKSKDEMLEDQLDIIARIANEGKFLTKKQRELADEYGIVYGQKLFKSDNREEIEQQNLDKTATTKIDMDEVTNKILGYDKKEDVESFVEKMKKKPDLNEQNKKELSFDEIVKSEDTFGNEFEKQYKRLQKYIGKDETSKGELAIALSDAIGTPGTLAEKAATLNSFLLSKIRAKKADKKELAKLAFAAATDLEKARTVAGKETFEEKRFNKLFKAADVINNKDKYSEEAVSAAQDYLKTTRDIQDLLKDKKGDFTLTGATVAKTISELPKTKRKLAKERAKGDKARPEKIAEYEQEIALAEAFLSKDLAAIQRLLKSDGGRVNLAESFPGTVGEAAEVQKAPAAQVDRLDYNALRTRLPREITDDIVRLLVNDDQALQDFSYIRTQGDVNSFNLKYGVTLVLPPESA
jgi:hypothetical protein